MIEFLYDNLLKEYVVYDDYAGEVLSVGGVGESADVFMLALFNVPSVKEGSDGRS
jgi:hypothetical protein